ncbi:TAXI family TRAP transporter solute-binding subunit [Pukyongiella litopenaei]|uniref:TAXI family TRAP transporter solute-binding subunit n=1 Tax=Pukyongiella litopenaei TaxID=2605946 RepID=A0A2S0MNY9_9RHOB|nr:TAXI family TRAP transporter solute-binding subunit [Pukyongiella litopenaei]AVO37461.1 TAXI family TRAP transporter solute-binding subunit [Pukyongiella litopenaei]
MAFLTRTARCLAVAAGLMFAGAIPVPAQEFEKNILTGGPTGTYIQFGRDIAGLLDDCGQTLHVQESAGSLENFLGVRKRRATQFGIVQSDVLEYLRTYSADDPAIARAIAGVRIAFPLYNEEIHLLATRDIGSVSDLAGKRVAIGVEDSGTFLTASLVLDLLDVDGVVRRTITPDESMAQLLGGELDAFFYVAGAPTRIFQNEAIDPARFHLVPISDPVLNTVYTPTSIPAGTYPFQSGPIEAVAVKAVLMTYEYDRNRNAYHRASCQAVSDVSHLILTRFPELRENGHPKWQQVDLGDIPPGWDIGACVNIGLAPAYNMQCGAPTTAAPVDDSAANSAYRKRICDAIGC